MSAVLRCIDQDPIEVSGAWLLAEQIAEVDEWLADSGNLDSVRGAILDIGFNSRLNDTNVAVQGETIPLAFMHKLVQGEVTRWLSLYPPFSESP